MCKHIVVIWIRGEKPAEGQVDPARLVARELAVAKVRLVHDLREPREATIPKPGPLQQRFEGAVVTLVGELSIKHIERNGAMSREPGVA